MQSSARIFLFGFLPALELLRPELVGSLKDSGQTANPKQARTGSVLVAIEVSIAVLLLCGAVLLVRRLS